jgi:hypothetical protein
MKRVLSAACCVLSFAAFFVSCGKPSSAFKASFPKNSKQQLDEKTFSLILQDMKRYTEAVRELDHSVLKTLDDQYSTVTFETEQKPLFLNVYSDKPSGQIVFLMMPKDPETGSNYLFQFPKNLPVINGKTVELQIRTQDAEKPLTCMMKVPDPAAYMPDFKSHEVTAQYELKKHFLQSGTYDFDALNMPSYRQRGYPFVTFDYQKAQVIDKTANLTADCKMTP